MMPTGRGFNQQVGGVILALFYSSVLIIIGLLYYMEKSQDVYSRMFPMDNIADYLN